MQLTSLEAIYKVGFPWGRVGLADLGLQAWGYRIGLEAMGGDSDVEYPLCH